MCNPQKIKCVKKIYVEEQECLQKCQGLFITGLERRKFDDLHEKFLLSKIVKDYSRYKATKAVDYYKFNLFNMSLVYNFRGLNMQIDRSKF